MLPQRKASLLGMELTTLSNDDGERLAKILWQLRHEVRSDPSDLWAVAALGTAQALAGLTAEACRTAIRSLELLESVPIVPADLQLNVAVRLLDAGFMKAAKRCLERLESRLLEAYAQERRQALSLGVALRSGDFDWLEPRLTGSFELENLRNHGLHEWWPRHQQLVEAAIGARVSSFEHEAVQLDDGTHRLVLDYFTDATSYAEVERLDAAMWEALKPLHHDHPDGPGMLLGAVILTVHGPKIPLEDLAP